MNRQPRLTYFKVAFSQNGRRLYVAGDDTYIQCFDPLASSRLDRIIGHEDSVTGLAVLKNGSLVSGSRDSTVKRWKSGSDASVARPDLHTKRVKSVAFAPTGYLMASTGYDGTVQLYDVAKRQIVKTLRDDPSRKMSLAFSPTGEHLAAADVDSGRVLVWNVPQGTLQHTWQSGADRALSICFTRSGQLVAGCGGGHISVWDLSSGECIAMFEAHDGEDVFAVHASPVDNIVASGGWDGKVILWDSRTWQPMKTIATADIRINGLQISPDGRMFAATTSRNVELWDMRTYSRITTLSGHQRAVNPPAFSPDGITLASGSWDGTVRLWDLRTFSEKTSFPAHSNGVAFSADGCYLVSAGPHEPYVTVWSATDMGD
jgi:WD40 repeat protein